MGAAARTGFRVEGFGGFGGLGFGGLGGFGMGVEGLLQNPT